MAESQIVHSCRFHRSRTGATRTLYLKKELVDEFKECFTTGRDFSAVFDPEKETLTIFKARLPP